MSVSCRCGRSQGDTHRDRCHCDLWSDVPIPEDGVSGSFVPYNDRFACTCDAGDTPHHHYRQVDTYQADTDSPVQRLSGRRTGEQGGPGVRD